jgi:hypothetical protein
MQLDGCADFPRSFIWSRVSGLMRFRDGSHKRTASNFVQIPEKVRQRRDPGNETSVWGRKHEPYTESLNSHTQKRSRQVNNKVRSMLIIFVDIKLIVDKEFVLAGQTVNSTYYCDVLWRVRENARRLRPEHWWQKNWLLHHDNAPSCNFLFTRKFLTKTNMTVVPHTSYFSLFRRLKIKLKCRHFDPTEVIEAESQAVLNTLGMEHTRGRKLLRGWWWPVGPQLDFDKTTALVPEITDDSLFLKEVNKAAKIFWQSKIIWEINGTPESNVLTSGFPLANLKSGPDY